MKSELEALLKHPLQVQVKDGRVFIGCFYGTDKLLNVFQGVSQRTTPATLSWPDYDSVEDCCEG